MGKWHRYRKLMQFVPIILLTQVNPTQQIALDSISPSMEGHEVKPG